MDCLLHAQVLAHAATSGAEDPGGMRFVDQQHGIVPLSQLGQIDQRRQVAIHTEEGVGYDQPATECAGHCQSFA